MNGDKKLVEIAYSSIFSALVFVFTVAFSLYIPETRGFFNIGEAGVYIAALVGGPVVGGIAGGVGSMLADLYLGYYWYAPATLVIKGIEGCLVGFLSEKLKAVGGSSRLVGGVLALLGGSGMFAIGRAFYLGETEIYLGWVTLQVRLNDLIWGAIAVLFMLSAVYLMMREPGISGIVAAQFVGGAEMILGYFLYEQLILGYAAIAEVPFNVMQCLMGTLIATNVYRVIGRGRMRP